MRTLSLRARLALVLLFSPAWLAATSDDPEPPVAPPSQEEVTPEVVLEEASPEGAAGEKEEADAGEDVVFELPDVEVTHTREDIFRLGGSAQVIDQEVLEAFEYDDPNSILLTVPGVYVRQEDGYGLRPNIGLRGANSERSKKVTLMVDGILLAPAPYSSPAAYFFPLMTRMIGLEVFKGPAAIMYGPHTIGGAINLVTRDIPRDLEMGVDAAYGTDTYAKGHLHVGMSNDWGGFLVEGVHLHSDGFKELDGGGDTGFDRTSVMVKGRVHTDPAADDFHQVEFKVGFSREVSDETYLGLTDVDFKANPNRRYRASALDHMDWERWSTTLRYAATLGEALEIRAALYRQDFSRSWKKVGGFVDGLGLSDLLADPDSAEHAPYYAVLTGDADSETAKALSLVTKAKDHVSQGAQTSLRWQGESGPVAHEVEAGVRYHYDETVTEYTKEGYLMTSGDLQEDGAGGRVSKHQLDQAHALAAYARYGLSWEGLTVTPGLRFEYVATATEDYLDGDTTSRDQIAILPGVGLNYAVLPELALFAGVHRGYSPVSPGQDDEVNAETAMNYEAGLRYLRAPSDSVAEATFFYSDYANLLGECMLASGCDDSQLDQQFNAGAVAVMGLEVVLGHRFDVGPVHIPLRATYTYTQSTFQTAFVSDNPQFGTVEEGDSLPYVPEHQLSAQVGVGMDIWDFGTVLTYISPMRESAGQGEVAEDEQTDHNVVLDLHASVEVWDRLRIYARAENVLMQDVIVSRRPYGARPGKPFMVQAGLKFDL